MTEPLQSLGRRPALMPLAVVAALALGGPAPARALPVTVETVHPGLGFPVALRFAPDGRLFYLERRGRVMTYASALASTPTVWATLPTDTLYDRGMLGLAFHPDFPDSPYVYLWHSNASPLTDRIVRMTDAAGVGTALAVLRDDIPAASKVHHGGRLAFAPDGTLLMSYGDQNTSSASPVIADVRGKIHRYTSTGTLPADEPFGAGNRAEVRGVRNVFGLCFDPESGTGYFTENGPECDDEVNVLVPGGDYGWGPGDGCGGQPAGAIAPLVRFDDVIAPTGCVVVRHALYPGWDGDLVFGSYLDGCVRRLAFHLGSRTVVDSVEIVAATGGLLLDVTVGPDGLLWFSTTTGIGRLLPAPTAVRPRPRAAALAAWPNPSSGDVVFSFPVRAATAELTVLDIGGRIVRTWRGAALGSWRWDARDARGAQVGAGVYLVRWSCGAETRTVRIVRVERAERAERAERVAR